MACADDLRPRGICFNAFGIRLLDSMRAASSCELRLLLQETRSRGAAVARLAGGFTPFPPAPRVPSAIVALFALAVAFSVEDEIGAGERAIGSI